MNKLLLPSLLFLACCAFPLEVEQVKTPSKISDMGFKVKCKLDRDSCIREITKSCGERYYLISEKSYSAGLDNDLAPGMVPWYSLLVGCGNPPEGFTPAEMAMPSVIKESMKQIAVSNDY